MSNYGMFAADKVSILIDIGSAYTRVGFTSEYVPRACIRSRVELNNQIVSIDSIVDYSDLRNALQLFLQNIFFRHLGTNPNEKSVVLLESIFWPIKFRDTLIDVLFSHFQTLNVLVLPHHVMALYPLGLKIGLVLDVGYRESIAIPVFENVTVLDCAQYAPYGGKLLHQRIMDELQQRKAKIIYGQGGCQSRLIQYNEETLTEDVLEDIKVKHCFVAPFERGIHLAAAKVNASIKVPFNCDINSPPPDELYSLTGKETLTIPGGLRESVSEIMFEMFGEEATIATLIIEAIQQSPLDLRVPLASNIVIIGGGSMLPGFIPRVLEEIRTMSSGSIRYSSLPFANKFAIHNLPCPANYVGWLGASLFATPERIMLSGLSLKQYLSGQKIMGWSDF